MLIRPAQKVGIPGQVKRILVHIYDDVMRHHLLQVSAALSYYFVLAIFPALIFLSAFLASVPFPNFFVHVLVTLDRVLPHDAMRVIYSVLNDVTSSQRRTWLSFGTLGTIWIVSGAFDAIIEALSIAYGVIDKRPLWKTRLLALRLAATSGGLFLVALAVTIVGPRFGEWLASRVSLSSVFVTLWPFLRWTIAIAFTVLATEVLYYLGPCIRQTFKATIPGAIVSVAFLLGWSHLLGIYLRHFADYNRTYGVLGGFTAFMLWLYGSSFIMLLGAELNAKLVIAGGKRADLDASGESLDRREIDRRSTDRAA